MQSSSTATEEAFTFNANEKRYVVRVPDFVRGPVALKAAARGRCPACNEPIYSEGDVAVTSVGYFFGPGQHRHDDNCLTRTYVCANGHRMRLSVRRSCGTDPHCKWRGQSSCDCCGGKKLDRWPKEHRSA